MAITHTTATRTALATAVKTAIDAGSGAGKLVVMTSGDVEVATLTLSDPCGTVTNGVLTFSTITADSDATGGTAALFKVTDSDGTEVFRGTVGTSGADLNLSSVAIDLHDTVSVSSFAYNAAA